MKWALVIAWIAALGYYGYDQLVTQRNNRIRAVEVRDYELAEKVQAMARQSAARGEALPTEFLPLIDRLVRENLIHAVDAAYIRENSTHFTVSWDAQGVRVTAHSLR